MRKLAGIAFFLYCGLAFFFVIAWGIGSTEFDLPIGPPIFAVVSVALACVAVTRLARRSPSIGRPMRRLLLLASAVVFVDTAFYAAITPLLPHYVDELGISKSAAGVLAAAYPAGTFLGALPGGWLAARAGVRPTTVLGLSIMAVSSVAFAFGTSVVVLDAARFVQGVGGAMTWAGASAG